MGVIERSKVDDMVLQQLAGRETSIALVTDSTTDLPGDAAFRLGVVAVPLTLSLGEESFLDGVDISPEGFLDRAALTTAVPRSSQPAVADFAGTYRRLLEYRDGVMSVHIAGAMSGTVQAAAAAAREVDPRRVRVVDSCGVSVGKLGGGRGALRARFSRPGRWEGMRQRSSPGRRRPDTGRRSEWRCDGRTHWRAPRDGLR